MKYLLVILLSCIILLLNFRILVFNYDFYENISKDNPDFDKEKTNNLIDYLKNKKPLNENLYTEKEITHLKDVKNLISKAILVFYLLLIIFILLLARSYKDILNILLISGILNLIIIIILVLLNFSNLFYNFHLLFFQNKFWLLSPETILIRLFPEIFFENFFKAILKRIFIFSLFFILIGLVNTFKRIFTNIKRIFIY